MSGQVPQAEYEKWVHETTAGPEWAGLSLHYFSSSGNELFFTVRTFWDRRITLNVRQCKPAAVTPAISEILDAAERRTAMQILTSASGEKFVDAHDGSVDFDVQTAAFIAGKLGIREAVPLLLQLEQLATEPSSSTYVIDGLCYKENRPRQIAQLSLRRLGVSSNGYPATFVEIPGTRPAWKMPFQFANTTRSKAAYLITVGMGVKDVARILGYPDYLDGYHVRGIGDDDSVWEYDIDSAEPLTLRLIIHGEAVTNIDRLAPLWNATGLRDELLAH
jgi:hypothetical protein